MTIATTYSCSTIDLIGSKMEQGARVIGLARHCTEPVEVDELHTQRMIPSANVVRQVCGRKMWADCATAWRGGVHGCVIMKHHRPFPRAVCAPQTASSSANEIKHLPPS